MIANYTCRPVSVRSTSYHVVLSVSYRTVPHRTAPRHTPLPASNSHRRVSDVRHPSTLAWTARPARRHLCSLRAICIYANEFHSFSQSPVWVWVGPGPGRDGYRAGTRWDGTGGRRADAITAGQKPDTPSAAATAMTACPGSPTRTRRPLGQTRQARWSELS